MLFCLLATATGGAADDPPIQSLTDSALLQVEEAFGDPPPDDWEARYDAWLKTPEGIEEMKVWRSLK